MDNEPSQPAVNQILLNLTRRKDEIRDFLGLLQTLIVKTEKYELNLDQETLTECHQYLTTICKLIVANETEPSFGYELLGSEVDYIFNSLIKIIKEDLQNKDMADFNVVNSLNDLFLKLNLVLKNGSFEFFENNKQLLIKTSLIEEAILPFEELDNYLEVGSVLKDDEETTLFLSEIAKLHTDPGLISPYSAIVGPSFMGKTQVAFTLSHLIHVIYVNFLPVISTRAGSVQPIYRLFERIAQIFQIVIEQDIRSHPSYSISNQEASDIISYDWHSKTLGLLCVLMKMRQLKRNLDIKEWFTDIANIKSIIVPSMTISEFRDKTNGKQFLSNF